MPVVRFCNRIPRPVRCFEIFENDSRILVFFRGVAPDVEIWVGKVVTMTDLADSASCCRYSASRLLEPRVLIGSVIDYQFSDHPQIACMRRSQKRSEIIQCAEVWIDIKIVGN